MMRIFRTLGLGTAAVSLIGAALLTGAGVAQGADLHYQCQGVIPLPGLPNNLVNGTGCSGPVATGWGTITSTSTGAAYWCDPLKGQMMGDQLWAFGQNCHQL
jgi:hypothetical protein